MPGPHPKRPVRLPPAALANVPSTPDEAELVDALYHALSDLPPDERLAAMVAFGLAEGSTGVAVELDLPEEDAEALARSALQRLRGKLADVDLDATDFYASLRRGRRRTAEPGRDDRH
jgi:DNA-directed RNA polymerase specialized sigma24 family protein